MKNRNSGLIQSTLFLSLFVGACGPSSNIKGDINPIQLKPTITLQGDNPLVLSVGTEFRDPGYSAQDTEDGDITARVQTTSTVKMAVIGDYEIRYAVTDSQGASAEPVVRQVSVRDFTPPVIQLLGASNMEIEAGISFRDPGATALDHYDGDVSSRITVTGRVNAQRLGTYTLTYRVSDSSDNAASEVVRTVRVLDRTPPEIKLLGASTIEIEGGSIFNDPGATAKDPQSGDLTDQIRVLGSVDTTRLGVYTLRYEVTDGAGNTSSVERTVRVTPITVCHPEDFEKIRRASSVSVTQVCDVDFAEEPEFLPIDNFAGSFNGGGFEIRNIRIIRPQEDYVGLFRRASGTFHAVRLRNVHVVGGNLVGALVGIFYVNTSKAISDSSVDGSVEGQYTTGGLVGFLSTSTTSPVMTNCISAASVTSTDMGTSVQWHGTGGLIGSMNSGEVQDSSSTARVQGNRQVGGLVGRSLSGTITRSFASGEITGNESVGGLLGYAETGTISQSYATGNVTGNQSVGGLLGSSNGGTISLSYANGSVHSQRDYAGGLVGSTRGTISRSYATGSVTGNQSVGGLVGASLYRGTQIEGIRDVFATGDVTGTEYVSGLVGSTDQVTISRGLALGHVSGSGNFVGGILGFGYNELTQVNSSFWNTDVIPYLNNHGVGQTTSQLQDQSTYVGWDFNDVWILEPGQFPRLRGLP